MKEEDYTGYQAFLYPLATFEDGGGTHGRQPIHRFRLKKGLCNSRHIVLRINEELESGLRIDDGRYVVVVQTTFDPLTYNIKVGDVPRTQVVAAR